jgi:hypothetical protein
MRTAGVLKAYFEHKLNLQLELLTAPPSAPIEGMQFDLQISRLGLWGLRASRPLDEKSQNEIAASFHGLFCALDGTEDRRRELISIEDRITASVNELPSNVIPLRRAGSAQTRPFRSVGDKRWQLRLDCLIESQNVSEIHKMAFEMHSQSARYAFLEFHDLERGCRLNLSELLRLGTVSLFVPSILDLSLAEQHVLRQLMQHRTLERPLLMVGAQMAYSELRGEAAIDLEFLVLLSRAYIKLTRPFKEYKDQGLIHYFLDSISQNPT